MSCTCRRRRCVNVRLSLTKLWNLSTASKTAEPDRNGRTERSRPVVKHTNALTYGNVIKALHLIASLGHPSDAKSKPQFDFDEISKATRDGAARLLPYRYNLPIDIPRGSTSPRDKIPEKRFWEKFGNIDWSAERARELAFPINDFSLINVSLARKAKF